MDPQVLHGGAWVPAWRRAAARQRPSASATRGLSRPPPCTSVRSAVASAVLSQLHWHVGNEHAIGSFIKSVFLTVSREGLILSLLSY